MRGAFYFCVVCIFPSSHLYFGSSFSKNDLPQEIRQVCIGAEVELDNSTEILV